MAKHKIKLKSPTASPGGGFLIPLQHPLDGAYQTLELTAGVPVTVELDDRIVADLRMNKNLEVDGGEDDAIEQLEDESEGDDKPKKRSRR